jgi:hypothetical protein
MSNAPILDLIKHVNNIFARYEKVNLLTGENFNVFKILKLGSSEVRMHSAFLAELLSPKGSHGQNSIFLNLFVNKFCFKQNFIEAEHAQVSV